MDAHSYIEKKSTDPVAGLERFRPWKLEDAKARFSQLVKLAQEKEPQRVTVHGKDAVVVISAREFAKLLPLTEQPSLHLLLSESPLAKLEEIAPDSLFSPVRDVNL